MSTHIHDYIIAALQQDSNIFYEDVNVSEDFNLPSRNLLLFRNAYGILFLVSPHQPEKKQWPHALPGYMGQKSLVSSLELSYSYQI